MEPASGTHVWRKNICINNYQKFKEHSCYQYAYRTVSFESLCCIAGIPPITLKAEEIYNLNKSKEHPQIQIDDIWIELEKPAD